MQMKKYENCFSLGCFCGPASSLGKLGLRNFSGPFDWIHSNLDSVISQIDNEFVDFMKKENLKIRVRDNKPKGFKDTKYKFVCNHDVKEDFEIEYPEIYDKYIRRAERFMESIEKPTCFFRAISSEDEIEYIINNEKYIEKVLKKYNSENSIVYILLSNMKPLPDHFRWFRLSIDQYSCSKYEMRNMFCQSKELLLFCENLLSQEQMELNKKFDIISYRHKKIAEEVNYCVQHDIDGVENQISVVFQLQNDEPFYIFGGGRYGIPLYQYLLKRGMNIKAIIDNKNPDEFPSDMPIISPDDIESYSKIFIAISNEKSTDEVKEQIRHKNCICLTYKELP